MRTIEPRSGRSHPLSRWRLVSCSLVLALLLSLVPLLGYPDERRVSAGGLNPLTTTQAYPPPPVLASAAALLDADSGQWLYLKAPDRSRAMASTTKIMTGILAIEHGHLSDLVRVSRAAASIGQSSMGLVEGERVRMIDLLYGLMLPSGNDAGIAIAEHIAGSQRRFVALMNAKAASLHLRHTHYVNPFGFVSTADGDDPAHFTSARDLALLARYAMRDPLFRTIVNTRSYVVPATKHNQAHDLSNINKVIFWYPGADGVKPGWTSGAGICLVVDARRHGRHLILALLNTPNLHTDVRDLLNYGFGDFTWFPSQWSDDTIDQSLSDHSGAGSLFFPYTGHGVRGAMLAYFEAHGGYRVLGFPNTEQIPVDGQIQQFFTNQVLTYDAQDQVVTPLRLGLEAVPRHQWLARLPALRDTDWRTYYPQTGHSVTYRFREYYLSNGGPRTFGYPVTEKVQEGTALVQYFENAEFIWSGDPAGPGHVVLAPLGEHRLYSFGLLPLVSPSHLTVAPAVEVTQRPTRTATVLPPTITPLPTSTVPPTATASNSPLAPQSPGPSVPTPSVSPSAPPSSTESVTASPTTAPTYAPQTPSPVVTVAPSPPPASDTPIAPVQGSPG